jgi:hypothetical protein
MSAMTNSYDSKISLGEEYIEPRTGIKGNAVAISFFEHACERVTLRYSHDGDIKEATFDTPEVRLASEPTEKLSSPRRGGPARNTGSRRNPAGR